MSPINKKIGLIAVLITLLLAMSSWAGDTPVIVELELRMGSSSFYKTFSNRFTKTVKELPSGSSVIDIDANAGTGTSAGYLGMAYRTQLMYNYYPGAATTTTDDDRPITDIIIVDFGSIAAGSDVYYYRNRLYRRLHVINSGKTDHDYPLNRERNTGSHHLYLLYTKDYIDGRMITDIRATVSSSYCSPTADTDYSVVTDQNGYAANINTNGGANYLYVKKEYLKTGEYGDYATATLYSSSYYSSLTSQVMPYDIWGNYSVTSYGGAIKNCDPQYQKIKVGNKYEDAYWDGNYYNAGSWRNGLNISVPVGLYDVYIKKECGYHLAAVVEGPYKVRIRKLTSTDYNEEMKKGNWFYIDKSYSTVYSGKTAPGIKFSDRCLSKEDFSSQSDPPSGVTFWYSTKENGTYYSFNRNSKTWTSGTYYIRASRAGNEYCDDIYTDPLVLTVSKSKLVIKKGNGEADVVIEAEAGANISYELPPSSSMTRTGYTFSGWNGSVPSTMPAGVTTISAKWSAISYGLYLYRNNPNSASVYQTKSSNCSEGTNDLSCYSNELTNTYKYTSYNYGATISYPTWYKVGYKHSGWQKSDGTSYRPTSMPDNYVYLNAKWTPLSFTMTFKTGGGSTVPSITQGYETTITKPADPTREGYDFAGWVPEIPSKMPYGSTSYSAQWNIKTYYVMFYDGWTSSVIKSAAVKYNNSLSNVTYPKNPTRAGWTFVGWDVPSLPEIMPAKDILVTAQWKRNYYKVNIPEQFEIKFVDDYDDQLDKYGYNTRIQLRLKEGYKIWGDLVYTGSNTILSPDEDGNYVFRVKEKDGEVKADKITEDYGTIQILPDHSEAFVGYDTVVTDPIENPIEVDSVTMMREFKKNFAEVVMLPFDIGIQNVRGGVFCKFMGMEKSGFNYTARLMFVRTALAANTPYLFVPTSKKMQFKLPQGEKIAIKTSDMPENRQGDWVLRGNYNLMNWDELNIDDAYVFNGTESSKNGVNGSFKKVSSGDGLQLQPLSGYLIKESLSASGIRGVNGMVAPKTMSIEELPDEIGIRIETENGQTTALGKMNTATGEIKVDRWFDAQGRLLKGKPTIEGIYYNNGKKVIVK